MTEPLAIRLGRLDAEIDEERDRRNRSDHACDVFGYEFHERRIDDLISLRVLLAAGGILTATEET